MNFFRTIFEECHKNEVDQISKQNMKISKGQSLFKFHGGYRQTDDRQTDVRERESGYTIDPDDISRCRQDQKWGNLMLHCYLTLRYPSLVICSYIQTAKRMFTQFFGHAFALPLLRSRYTSLTMCSYAQTAKRLIT